jgi:hypothetical protein
LEDVVLLVAVAGVAGPDAYAQAALLLVLYCAIFL